MKYVIISCAFIFAFFPGHTQVPHENKSETKKSSYGFVLYVQNELPYYVLLKKLDSLFSCRKFNSNSIKFAFQLSNDEILIDTLDKYFTKLKSVDDCDTAQSIIKVLPVKIVYTVFRYAKTKQQFKNNQQIKIYRLADRTVIFRCYGEIPIRVDSLTIVKY